MDQHFSEAQWRQFQQDGYLRLGKVLSDTELATLQQRMDDIMLGTAPVDYDRMLMQLDVVPGQKGPGPQTKGHKGSTLNYRKIQDLEFDPVFLSYMQRPLFREICAWEYGPDSTVACYRAMFMNKPAHYGTYLNWHQDRWTHLDRDPQISVWLAFDPATIENGCVQIVPGTHHRLINPDNPSGFFTEAQTEELLRKAPPVFLELPAGEAVLLHNYLPHASDVNHTDIPRRAFSVCYMDAATQNTKDETYSIIFGEGALELAR